MGEELQAGRQAGRQVKSCRQGARQHGSGGMLGHVQGRANREACFPGIEVQRWNMRHPTDWRVVEAGSCSPQLSQLCCEVPPVRMQPHNRAARWAARRAANQACGASPKLAMRRIVPACP